MAAGAGGGAAPSLAMSEVPAFGRRRRLRDAGRERPQRGSAGGSGGWDGPGQDQRQGQRGGAAAASAAAAVGRAAPGPLLPLHLHGRPLQPPAREPGPAGAQVGPGPGAGRGPGSGPGAEPSPGWSAGVGGRCEASEGTEGKSALFHGGQSLKMGAVGELAWPGNTRK